MSNLIKSGPFFLLACISLLSFSVSSADLPTRGPIPFDAYDRDENGFVSADEFQQVRGERMAANAKQGRQMKGAGNAPSFSVFDTDGDGQLTQQELTTGQQAQIQNRRGMRGQGMGQGRGQGMRKGRGQGMGQGRDMPSFSEFDLNGDGSILKQEFYDSRAARMAERAEQGFPMRNAGNAPSFEDVDSNNDGKIDAEEFEKQQAQHRQQMMKRN